jgi:hypothetical protein
MKTWKLVPQEEMLLALLRAALQQQEVNTTCFQHATAENWLQCYLLAVHQGVAALAWEGVERLPVEFSPPLDVKLSWALVEKKQVAKYRKHYKAVTELTRFYAQHGIATMVLKGVGLSRLYPTPEHRVGGDIDIYTCSADKTRMTDEEANRLVDELMMERGMEVTRSPQGKDSHFLYHDILIENHRFFFDTRRFPVATEVEQWLEDHVEKKWIDGTDGDCDMNVPSITFERIYVSYHAALHAGIGLSLHHLCDMAVLFKHGGDMPDELNSRRFFYPVKVFAQLCNQYLGMEVAVDGKDEISDEIMKEILRTPYQSEIPYANAIQSFIYKTRRTLHCMKLMRRLLKPSLAEMVLPLLKIIISQPGRLIR